VVYWIRCRYRILTGSVADLDPGSCASLTLGSESGIPDLGSRIQTIEFGELSKKSFGLKYLNTLSIESQDPG